MQRCFNSTKIGHVLRVLLKWGFQLGDFVIFDYQLKLLEVMELTQFRELIGENNKEWFNSVPLELKFPVENQNKEFKGLPSLYKFAKEQTNGWSKLSESLPHEFNESKKYFDLILQGIISFVEINRKHEHGNENLNKKIQNNNSINRWAGRILFYNSTNTEFLLSLHENKPKSFSAAFSFIVGDFNHNNINNKDSFEGYLLAYEFQSKGFTALTERRNKEKRSITTLRNDFENQLPQLEKELTDHLTNSSEKYKEYVTIIDQLKADNEKTYSNWFTTTKDNFDSFSKGCDTRREELEKTYASSLKLEEPAKYWLERGDELKNEAWKSLYILVGLVLIIVTSLAIILWSPPAEILNSFFGGDKSAAIRWSIIYVTFISFMAFCIKAVSKVMFSSFHLARDCDERYTLTYFYLSLLKDSSVTDNEKQLIMQSLFSRADTGLLKEDSSPTMPNDIASKILGRS